MLLLASTEDAEILLRRTPKGRKITRKRARLERAAPKTTSRQDAALKLHFSYREKGHDSDCRHCNLLIFLCLCSTQVYRHILPRLLRYSTLSGTNSMFLTCTCISSRIFLRRLTLMALSPTLVCVCSSVLRVGLSKGDDGSNDMSIYGTKEQPTESDEKAQIPPAPSRTKTKRISSDHLGDAKPYWSRARRDTNGS